jgi:hypothetical protein
MMLLTDYPFYASFPVAIASTFTSLSNPHQPNRSTALKSLQVKTPLLYIHPKLAP